jgi:hypothetical protein
MSHQFNNLFCETGGTMLGYEENLSRLQRWILDKAYCGIIEAGSDEPQEYRRADSLPPVHLLRIEVLRDYFGIPLRTQKNDYGHKWLVIDNLTAGPKRANAARTSLSRSLKRLRIRGLISDSITLTPRGIDVAKRAFSRIRWNGY